jgi:catechol 2,3-dioxygenase-like lactoylglutathione lyase family enzyme
MKVVGSDHTSFTVANLERSLQFYMGLLGFEMLWKREEVTAKYFRDIIGFPDGVVRAALLKIPGSEHRFELFEYVHPKGTPADVRTNNPGSSHVALHVDDLKALYETMKAKGVTFRSPPVYIDQGMNAGGWAAYCLDPDGITVELFQPPPGRPTAQP